MRSRRFATAIWAASMDSTSATEVINKLSLGLAILLTVGYALGLLFTLKTHREFFAAAEHAETDETRWPIGVALTTLAGVTILVALVSEIFVESVQEAAKVFGMTPAFVGFIVVALVGGAAEMASAFSGARRLKFCERLSRPADESGKSCRARTRSAGCPTNRSTVRSAGKRGYRGIGLSWSLTKPIKDVSIA
ncbi:sodium/calcium antiporter protein [Rhizobium sp. NXC14]|nr:sodium/calcium antiporter protein [Rhizobium sp. NXC14]